jgi:hypothetical protein
LENELNTKINHSRIGRVESILKYLRHHTTFQDYDIMIEKLEEQLQLESKCEKDMIIYAISEEMYIKYIENLVKTGAWMGYKVALLAARLKHINLFIWSRSSNNSNALVLKDYYEDTHNVACIHMLHTGGFTHFNLLASPDIKNNLTKSADTKNIATPNMFKNFKKHNLTFKGTFLSKENLFQVFEPTSRHDIFDLLEASEKESIDIILSQANEKEKEKMLTEFENALKNQKFYSCLPDEVKNSIDSLFKKYTSCYLEFSKLLEEFKSFSPLAHHFENQKFEREKLDSLLLSRSLILIINQLNSEEK